jgi:Zn-finger nucleic acid-binding protein
MKCPACENNLTEIQVGSLKVDVCQRGCGGIWFDAFELQQVDQQEETAGEALLQIERDESLVVDASRKRACPRCPEVKLYRHWFSSKIRVQVDECPNCGGYWLDAGELAQIRSGQGGPSEGMKGSGSALSGDVIRYLYRMQSKR